MKTFVLLAFLTCLFASINFGHGRRIASMGGVAIDYSPTPEVIKNSTVSPLNYTIRVRPVLDEGYENLPVNTVLVDLRVRVKAITNSKEIDLVHKNLRLNLDGVKVTNASDGKELGIAKQVDEPVIKKPSPYDDHPPLPPHSNYNIELKEAFNEGDELELYIPYQFPLTEALHHSTYSVLLQSVFGFDKYNENNETKKFAVSTLEKYNTRDVIPLFERADNKPTFQIIIGRVDGKYKSLSNMDLDHTEPDQSHKGWVWDSYKETIPLYPHQIFMLVSDLVNNTSVVENQRVSVWNTMSFQEKNDETIKYMSDVTSRLMQYYSQILKMPFPSNKIDVLNLPTGSTYDAEHFGVILFNGGIDPIWDERISNKSIVLKIGEEIARQWIGSVISIQCSMCKYETQLQVDAFTYLRSLGVRHIMPDYSLEELFDMGSLIFQDHSSRTRLKMMEEIFGEQIMESALANLISMKKFQVASDNDLYEALDVAIKEHNSTHLLPSPEIKTKEIIPDWLLYSPEIIVRVEGDNGKLVFSQEGINYYRPKDKDAQNTSYWTPIVFQTESGESHSLWLPKNGSNVTFDGKVDTSKWVLVNPNGVAPYRIIYDQNITQALATQLLQNPSTFESGARIRLIKDYTTMSQSGQVSVEEALEMLRYIGKETDDAVWRIALDKMIVTLLDNMKDDDEALRGVKSYFAPKVQSLVERIGWDGVKFWYPLERVCLSLGVPACIEQANKNIANWKMNSELKPIDAFSGSAPGPVPASENICAAIENSKDASTWGFILNKFLTYNNSDSYGKFLIVEGLACQQNLTLVKNLLEQSITMHEGTQKDIYGSFARRSTLNVKKALYEFAKEKVISGKISPETFAYTIGQLEFSSRLSPNVGKDLTQFIEANNELLKDVKPELEAHMKDFNGCTRCDWWDSVGNEANKWLSKNA